ncbi:hypothetical protein PsorP6_006316 [Peronosclerospora sorghi]|uniref:Uncharacterized protein n=1 Tax=Peronosclerospora sorghi TaxID=230839 RepID=A0ACC0W8Y6_9STRA|nr:hypothetical protein PsorP6_006316 [Peronosclerospora sorghi]
MGKSNGPPQWTGKSIRKLSLYKRRVNAMNWEYGLEHVPFMVLYAYSLYYCYLTVDEPYAQAMKEMEEEGFVIGDAGIAGTSGHDGVLDAAMLSQGVVREALTKQAMIIRLW